MTTPVQWEVISSGWASKMGEVGGDPGCPTIRVGCAAPKRCQCRPGYRRPEMVLDGVSEETSCALEELDVEVEF
jgi:hypothetical protein